MLCRLCLFKLNETTNSLQLYDEIGETIVIKIISKFLHLKLEQNDEISTMICNDCWQHLDDFQKFYRFVEERQIIGKKEYEENKYASDESETKVCTASEFQILDVANYKQSLSDINDPKTKTISQETKDKTTMEVNKAVESHWKGLCKAKLDEKNAKSKHTKNASKICKRKRTIRALKGEKKYDKAKTITLATETIEEKCGEIILDAEGKVPRTGTENDHRIIVSDYCKTESNKQEPANVQATSINETQKNSAKTYFCSYCAQVYRNKTYFNRHVAEHEGTVAAQVQCPMCKKMLKNKSTLHCHMTVHEQVVATCEICGRVCSTKRALQSHIQYMHLMDANFVCTVCGKAFRRKDRLCEHMGVHTRKKTACPHCDKEYQSKSKLYEHIRTKHVQERLQAELKRTKVLQKVLT